MLKKPDTKECILYDTIHQKYKYKINVYYSNLENLE